MTYKVYDIYETEKGIKIMFTHFIWFHFIKVEKRKPVQLPHGLNTVRYVLHHHFLGSKIYELLVVIMCSFAICRRTILLHCNGSPWANMPICTGNPYMVCFGCVHVSIWCVSAYVPVCVYMCSFICVCVHACVWCALLWLCFSVSLNAILPTWNAAGAILLKVKSLLS